MMKSKLQLLLCCLILQHSVTAQWEYEPSAAHPFGQPNPAAPKQLLDFAPLIGECNCKSQSLGADQKWAEPVDMVWRFKYIMNGMAVQDETLKADGKHSGSIRQFVADSLRWYVHYYNSASPALELPVWEGTKKDNNKIILYKPQKAPNGMDGFYRLSFYDIDKNGFKWIGEWVDKTESVVFPTWKINCRKREIQE
ncbi:hypothetical protein [uncultured Croceitalea sp.]|uniref:hypothetical protein n=1 Tax=uncultured Croceitalea sp. TaxID=1798908 RepID=UPI003305DC0A